MCSRVAIIKEGSLINIQDIKSLQKENYKKVRIAADGLDVRHFQIENIANLEQSNGTVSFFFKGDINILTRLIGEIRLKDAAIEDPTLEEIFMHYYE